MMLAARRAATSQVKGCVTTRTFPAMKYALGHGQACVSVDIGGYVIAAHKVARSETAYA